ncbi:ParB domain protein nuclease [Afipia sp. 1NLS2]|nr:ParB domain protein nuclease [Afipia sp. 1NLS2]
MGQEAAALATADTLAIIAAVSEAVGPEAAERTAAMKKAPMAETAEQLVAGTGWLPWIIAGLAIVPASANGVTRCRA